MKLSVIMTVYNRPGHLRAALQALALQRDPDLEVVVADDGSDPEPLARIQQVAAETPFPCHLVRRQRDGFRLAAARNDAVRHSQGDILVFIDCDIALLPGALTLHRGLAAEGRFLAGHRRLATQASTETLLAGSLTEAGLEEAWRLADSRELDKAARRFRVNAWLRRLRLVKRHKPKLIGCHFSLSRADFERINGFDETFVGWGLEDDDLALRLYAAGCRSLSVMTSAHALHLWHPSLQPDSARGFASPNLAYFGRPVVPARCECGLVREGKP